jgi:hypothetical protein
MKTVLTSFRQLQKSNQEWETKFKKMKKEKKMYKAMFENINSILVRSEKNEKYNYKIQKLKQKKSPSPSSIFDMTKIKKEPNVETSNNDNTIHISVPKITDQTVSFVEEKTNKNVHTIDMEEDLDLSDLISNKLFISQKCIEEVKQEKLLVVVEKQDEVEPSVGVEEPLVDVEEEEELDEVEEPLVDVEEEEELDEVEEPLVDVEEEEELDEVEEPLVDVEEEVEEEEVEEEEVEVEVEVEEEEVEEEEEEVEVEVEEEVEVEVEEEEVDAIPVNINNIRYYTTSEIDGTIYSIGFDGEIGDEVGVYVNGKPILNKK